jgi:hypothetical protein
VVPGGRSERIGEDGALYRVHTFYIINDEDQIVTDDTIDGPQPIMIQSVPMRITRPVIAPRPRGLVLH